MSGKSGNVLTNCDVPALWLEHKTALRNFILKRVDDSNLADDILQETLLKIYRFCMERSGVQNVRSWLFQIAHNTLMDHYRQQAKTIHKEVLPEVIEEDSNEAFVEAQQYILPMLEFLPTKYAQPLKMADIDGMKQAVIAEKLGLSLTAVKTRIQRARQLLKAEFMTCCHFETDKQGNIIAFSIKESCTPLQEVRKKIAK